MSFSLITKKLACCWDCIMRSICCSCQSKSGEQFCTALHAPQVILFMPGSEFSHSYHLLRLQTFFVHAVCLLCTQAHETKSKNPRNCQHWNSKLKIIWKMPVEVMRRVKHLRIASKLSGKKKRVPVLNARSVAVLT